MRAADHGLRQRAQGFEVYTTAEAAKKRMLL